jgi:hypothetical protein
VVFEASLESFCSHALRPSQRAGARRDCSLFRLTKLVLSVDKFSSLVDEIGQEDFQ